MRPLVLAALAAALASLTTACDSQPGTHDAGIDVVTDAGDGDGRVTVSVSGPGRVTSEPAGINCGGGGGTACSYAFTAPQIVLATDPGTTVRWSGACAGNGDCALALGRNRTVTATTFAPLRRTFDDDDHGFDACWAIIAGSSDSIVVTGEIQRLAQGYNAWTRAYDAGGAVLWTYELNTPSEGQDRGNDVIATPGGGAIVAGTWYSGSNTRRNYFLSSIDATGALAWLRESEVIDDDMYLGLARDAAGALIVAGSRPDGVGGSQAWLRKLDAAGNVEAWAVTRDGSAAAGADAAVKVAVDSAKNVIAVGYETNAGTGRDGWINKLDARGAPIWSIRVTSPGAGFDEMIDVAVAKDDSIAVVGRLEASSTVRVYAGDGSPRWNVPAAGKITWRAVAVDAGRNVLAAGSAGPDLLVHKYDPAGALVWQRSFAGAAGRGVATDSQGNVLVCGDETVAGGKTDLLLLRFNQ
jgi:hypothetical protein